MSAKPAFVLLLILAIAAGCAPPQAPTAVPVAASETAIPSSASVVPSLTAAPSPAPSAELPAPSTAQPVTITAVKGNLYIRRGPDVAFNPVAVLSSGQTATALARDVLAKWVQVPIPGNSEKRGWVSIQTTYSTLAGDVASLPEIQPTEWPEPAFLRNCTLHDMTAEPGGILLPALNNFPANDVRMNPGTYRVYDNVADGYPEVLKVELREGSAIDIRVDGDGLKRKCPEP